MIIDTLIECLLSARHYSKHIIWIDLFYPSNNPEYILFIFPIFIDKILWKIR